MAPRRSLLAQNPLVLPARDDATSRLRTLLLYYTKQEVNRSIAIRSREGMTPLTPSERCGLDVSWGSSGLCCGARRARAPWLR